MGVPKLSPLAPLEGDQRRASNPSGHAALSASAGTGKTHVLTARVLRLLLAGVDPSSILCLTFTKAGAAEMADRIHARLAHWVRLKDSDLRKELFALGESNDQEAVRTARTLFARVLDAAGGGLRIQTIHAFAQSLLGSFPSEADLVPGFRALEGREEQLLARQTLAESLVTAEGEGDLGFIRDLQILSHRLGEGGAEALLMRCARYPEAMDMLGAREGIEARLRRAFDLPAGDIEAFIATQCQDESFDVAGIARIGRLNELWASKNGLERARICERWLTSSAAERGRMLEDLHSVWARRDGELRSFAPGQAPQEADYADLARRVFEGCTTLIAIRKTAGLVASLAAGLRAGQAFARAYVAAKRAAGLVDFDDLIRSAERLLLTPGMGDWVRYKLDQGTDHILVDEAQDTNESQWNIVRALSAEYFSGKGASSRRRTIFTVGDYKQAIFGFQGTNPESFNVARAWFSREAEAIGREFLDLSMDRSFRSSPPILTVVDQVIDELGHEAMGLPDVPNRHESHHSNRPGAVTLWKPFSHEITGQEDEAAGDEGWISDTVRLYAARLARQIRHWLDNPFMIASRSRPIRPEDILILVRRRSQLAALIVARLHAEGVPVAGVDRLLLSAPLAVQDLLAAVRFAAQPLDDLNLAALLVSPLIGWSQERLFEAAYGREGRLWPRLRDAGADGATLDSLGGLLAMADYATPHQFLETILSGPLDGRRKLLGRLGPEARDPIEELLTSALEFEAVAAPSLQRFLDWFARGDVEIVRDPSTPRDAVRVMTVHGSKGLQSPVVVLADACADPDRRGGGQAAAFATMTLDGVDLPILRPRKEELGRPLKDQLEIQEQRERQEHWRLLYVAMTRAEERLYVGGALGLADRKGPPIGSWYHAVGRAMEKLEADTEADPLWGQSTTIGNPTPPAQAISTTPPDRSLSVPAWLIASAPVEARPPRPLAPSTLGLDDVRDPPPSAGMRLAAERGRLLHQLFERMPAAPFDQRQQRAAVWLEHSAGVIEPGARRALVEAAEATIANPDLSDIFGPDALVEAPIAAVLANGVVVTGTVDRLLVSEEEIRLVDFKTGRSVPERPDDIPVPHLRQMAAYAAALEVIFPDRRVEALLLYTSGPLLHRLSPALLDRFRPEVSVDG